MCYSSSSISPRAEVMTVSVGSCCRAFRTEKEHYLETPAASFQRPSCTVGQEESSHSQGPWTKTINSPCGPLPFTPKTSLGQQSRPTWGQEGAHSQLLCPALVRDQKQRFKTLVKIIQTLALTSKLNSQPLFPVEKNFCAFTVDPIIIWILYPIIIYHPRIQ